MASEKEESKILLLLLMINLVPASCINKVNANLPVMTPNEQVQRCVYNREQNIFNVTVSES